MRPTFLFFSFVMLLNANVFAQNTSFNFQGFSVGNSLNAPSNFPRAMMPEIIRTETEYIMYFGYESPTQNYIMYATSNDMNTWTVGDTVLMGSSDSTSREFIIGGPRVIQLSNGQYRMFYRCSQKYTTAPYYHIRSAISNDAKNFTKEGICIEIKNYNPTSFFKHVGHSEFYYDAGNNLRALLTAKDTTMTVSQPDNIYTAQSTDGGLTWSNFVSKYQSCHDPVVIKDSSNNYHTYFTYLNTAFKTANSTNGVAWPVNPDFLYMIQNGDTITESSSPIKIADLGAGVNANGDIIIFSNHASAPGPWTHVAYWTQNSTIGLNAFDEICSQYIYPNPTTNMVYLNIVNDDLLKIKIFNLSGKMLDEIENTSFSISNYENGTYLINILTSDRIITTKLIKE